MARTSRRALKYFGESRQEQERNAYTTGMWARAVLFGDEPAKRWLSNNNKRGML